MSIYNEISRLNTAKMNLKAAIEAKGVSVPESTTLSGYGDLVSQIKTGGGISGEGAYVVTVYDYDGTVLLQQKANTGDTITMPTAPTHDRLTFQEWSSTTTLNSDGQSVTVGDNDIDIGATYTTTSGNTEFDIVLTKATGLYVAFKPTGIGSPTINWGDGVTNTEISHTYSSYGKYTIQVSGAAGYRYYVFDQSTSEKNFFCICARFDNSVTSIGEKAFILCYSLKKVSIPNSVTFLDGEAFSWCTSLKFVVVPKSVNEIESYAFNSCHSLLGIVLPENLTTCNYSCFNDCNSLQKIVIPNLSTISSSFCCYCFSLTKIIIPKTVSSISANAFSSCYGITLYDFTRRLSVPTLSSTQAFLSINNICKIVVPDNLYNSWINATNWTTYADYIYKASEVNL